MNYIGKFISNFKVAYNEINGATLTGAIDAVVVRQKDGSYVSSPFHVRFGKIGVLRSREKVVDIEINGAPVDIHMKLGETGEAFFVEELAEGDEVSPLLGTSPLPEFLNYNANEDTNTETGVEPGEVLSNPLNTVTEAAQNNNGGEGPCQSGSVEVPCKRGSSWREDLVRSKSLTTESPLARALLEGQDSKTDVEDTIKAMNRANRRRRKKRTSSRKRRTKASDSHSSDNSTTSETADLASLSVTGLAGHPDPIFVMEDVETVEEPSDNLPSAAQRLSLKNKEWNGRMSVSLGPDFHPFSDTDISPPPSPSNSRSNTPVKSDTEYECEKQRNELSQDSSRSRDAKWSWTWGELPTPPTVPSKPAGVAVDLNTAEGQEEHARQTRSQEEDAQRSMLGNMFSFMRATKKARHNPESEGIYLDDLNLDELEPEVAALYFPRNSDSRTYVGFRSVTRDEDVESGNGTSLPHSPHSVEGAIGGAKPPSVDSDFEDSNRHPIFDFKSYEDIAFSLCGALHEHQESFPESLFQQSMVTYDDFCEHPDLLESPNLVVRFGGKYMNWATAGPQIAALVLFQRPLPSRVVDVIAKEHMPKKEIRKRSASRGYSWFSWGRQNVGEKGAAPKEGEALPGTPDSSSMPLTSSSSSLQTQTSTSTQLPLSPAPAPNETLVSTTTLLSHEVRTSPTHVTETHRASYIATVTQGKGGGGTEVVTMETGSAVAKETVDMETGSIVAIETGSSVAKQTQDRDESSESEEQDERRYRKTIRLSSDQIKKLNLRNGSNEVVFSVTTAYQGTTRCKCHIFLWNYDEKIVVSDIDGTITKSDVLGHILPIIGKDWAQGGVAQLFTKIKNNGYNFLYLSARAIGQARITREYLRSIKQGDVSLPDGPLLLNPTSLINAFHREVIERKPEEFKISCLRDIKALFPPSENPFYAGYGNRINDVWAYSAVGIPIQRIFTINHRGELKHELTQTFQTTYSNLSDIVNHMFPPPHGREAHDEFTALRFWSQPLPDLSKEIEEAISSQGSK